MRDASVGFQCPECVKEGARSTRQGRATYGGTAVRNPGLTSTVLIAVNAVVWLAIQATGGNGSRLVDYLALLPQSSGLRLPGGNVIVIRGVSDGAYWQLVTSMFTHVDLIHIGFNMLALYFLGPWLESMLGRARFLAVYLVSGVVGSAAVMWLSSPNTPVLGASGAVFGLMGALVVVALKKGADVRQLGFWILLNLAFTFYGRGSISWQGHLGGLVGGAVLAAIIVYAPRDRRTLLQWTGITLVLLLALAASAARALSL